MGEKNFKQEKMFPVWGLEYSQKLEKGDFTMKTAVANSSYGHYSNKRI